MAAESAEHTYALSLRAERRVRLLYTRLFAMLSLNSATIDRFVALLRERDALADNLNRVLAQHAAEPHNQPAPSTQSIRQAWDAAEADVEARIGSLIGDADYAVYRAYEASLSAHSFVAEFQQLLAANGVATMIEPTLRNIEPLLVAASSIHVKAEFSIPAAAPEFGVTHRGGQSVLYFLANRAFVTDSGLVLSTLPLNPELVARLKSHLTAPQAALLESLLAAQNQQRDRRDRPDASGPTESYVQAPTAADWRRVTDPVEFALAYRYGALMRLLDANPEQQREIRELVSRRLDRYRFGSLSHSQPEEIGAYRHTLTENIRHVGGAPLVALFEENEKTVPARNTLMQVQSELAVESIPLTAEHQHALLEAVAGGDDSPGMLPSSPVDIIVDEAFGASERVLGAQALHAMKQFVTPEQYEVLTKIRARQVADAAFASKLRAIFAR